MPDTERAIGTQFLKEVSRGESTTYPLGPIYDFIADYPDEVYVWGRDPVDGGILGIEVDGNSPDPFEDFILRHPERIREVRHIDIVSNHMDLKLTRP